MGARSTYTVSLPLAGNASQIGVSWAPYVLDSFHTTSGGRIYAKNLDVSTSHGYTSYSHPVDFTPELIGKSTMTFADVQETLPLETGPNAMASNWPSAGFGVVSLKHVSSVGDGVRVRVMQNLGNNSAGTDVILGPGQEVGGVDSQHKIQYGLDIAEAASPGAKKANIEARVTCP